MNLEIVNKIMSVLDYLENDFMVGRINKRKLVFVRYLLSDMKKVAEEIIKEIDVTIDVMD